MNPELQQLVQETIAVTGAAPPSLLNPDAPILSSTALNDDGFYCVGMIGGKDVGKSALVNALVGQNITASTAFGPGTDTVIAYAHESQAAALRDLLDREVRGQYRIVTHRVGSLARQVLLDLPDIDSHWQAHVELTRRMLRHLLFPLWVQSVEKYADAAPQQLLAKVAEGNAANNFLFCLNKADQLGSDAGATAAVEELRGDFARRIGQTLKIALPRVWMLSAATPEAFDLPALRALLSQQKSTDDVRSSQQLATRRQQLSIHTWLDAQDLPGRAERLQRLARDAEELLAERLGVPLLETALPALADDPASRLALTDEVLALRVNRWPIVNLVQTAMAPLLAVVRRNVGVNRTASLPDAEALVEAHLQINGSPLSVHVRSVFAQLQQSQPQISELYRHRKLWEDMSADIAAVQLRTALTHAVARQRELVRRRLAGGPLGAVTAPLRWLLTIGAALWFPFLQPVALVMLTQTLSRQPRDLMLLAVRIFSVNDLLQNLTFLAMYFLLLWIILRWDTQRRVARLNRRQKADSGEFSLPSVAVAWMDELVSPLRAAAGQTTALATRAKQLQDVSDTSAAA
jgi:hypothetical protein